MFPTRPALSKASRLPLISKHGNKDYYKGNRTAYLPGGHRTGAPGVHIVRGKGKFRIVDEKVRVYIAPPLEELNNTALRPYVHVGVTMDIRDRRALFGKFRGPDGMDGRHYIKMYNRLKERESPDYMLEKA